jgi:hypothetical protein
MTITPKRDRRICPVVLTVLLAVWSIVGGGCASTPRYKASAASPANGAQVKGSSEFRWFRHWYRIRLEQVDGEKVGTSFLTNWKKPVLVDPGDRRIRVECEFSVDGSATESLSVDLNVSLQADHTYELRCGIDGDSVGFWVEDTKTQARTGMQRLAVNTPPESAAKTAAGVAVFLLFRTLLLLGTGG